MNPQTVARAAQTANLARVETRLGTQILWFCKERVNANRREFHMDDLRKHLASEGILFAPASPDRVLRQLRILKVLDYRVVNRRQSLYEVTGTILTPSKN